MNDLEGKKIAIVHDWLVGGGAEKVVLQLHELFPDAPIYTSYSTKIWRQKLNNKVVTGYLQNWPFSWLRKFLPLLRQAWFSNLDLSKYDVVISSSGNGEAKFVRAKKDATHICYCHSPTHFYWRHYNNYLKTPGFGVFNPLARAGLKFLVNPLRKADYKAAQRVDYFIANSSHIANDIKKYYDRDSSVVYPPVDTKRFSKAKDNTQPRSGFVTVGRLVPNKRVDLIIQACNQLNAPLTVIGNGPEYRNLKKLAGKNVTFIKNASDTEINSALAGAKAFIFAGFEDFGIAPVEALASGTPVIAYRAGGALDYVVEGKTGIFFNSQTIISLAAAIKSFESASFNSNTAKKAASKFSESNFQKNIRNCIEKSF